MSVHQVPIWEDKGRVGGLDIPIQWYPCVYSQILVRWVQARVSQDHKWIGKHTVLHSDPHSTYMQPLRHGDPAICTVLQNKITTTTCVFGLRVGSRCFNLLGSGTMTKTTAWTSLCVILTRSPMTTESVMLTPLFPSKDCGPVGSFIHASMTLPWPLPASTMS